MAFVTAPLRFTFRDIQGRTATLRMYRKTSESAGLDDLIAGAAALNALWAPLTNASVRSNVDAPSSPVYGANAEYSSAQDKAALYFVTATGARHEYQVPAPRGNGAVGSSTNIFLADGITVNLAQTAVAALVAEALVEFTDAAGNLMTAYIGGLRLRRKLPRRTNIFVLAPDDTSPEE